MVVLVIHSFIITFTQLRSIDHTFYYFIIFIKEHTHTDRQRETDIHLTTTQPETTCNQTGRLKMRDMKIRDGQNAGPENARYEFAAPVCTGGNCRT